MLHDPGRHEPLADFDVCLAGMPGRSTISSWQAAKRRGKPDRSHLCTLGVS